MTTSPTVCSGTTGHGAEPAGAHGRIQLLLIDAGGAVTDSVTRLLTGYDVVVVPNNDAALASARAQRPGLVLAQVMRPDVDGFALLREMRADQSLRSVPVVLHGATVSDAARGEGLEAGADDYLLSPFSDNELLASVSVHLRLAEARRQVHEGRHASERRHRALLAASSDIVYGVNADSSTLHQLDGHGPEAGNLTSIDQWMQRHLPESEHARLHGAIREAVLHQQPFDLEHQSLHADGTSGWTRTRAVPIMDDDGSIAEWLWTATDVSRRKQAEEELDDLRSRMDSALRVGAIGTWAWDVEADRFYGDASFARIFGLPQAVITGIPIADILTAVHPDDQKRVGQLVQQAVHTCNRYEADYRVRRPDGSVRWVTARGQVTRDATGSASRFPGVVIDVTERHLAEAELDRVTAESDRLRRLYETILSNTPDFIYVFRLDHKVLYANESLIRMWGRGADGAIGKTFLEIGYEPWHAEMHDREIDIVRQTKQPIRGEVPFSGTFGRRIYEYIFVPVLGANGEVEAVAGTTRDVTDRKEIELAISESDRKKDEFIALLAHELRNPLAPIRNGLQVVRLTTDAVVRERAEKMMERHLTHMVRLIDDLLDVSRISQQNLELRLAPVTLADVVEHAVEAARPVFDSAGHELCVDLPEQPVHLNADLTRLAQVLSNLLTNAVKYTRVGGTIRITAERTDDVVEVAVTDTGIGLPADSLEGIFDMFSQVDRSIERATGGLGIGLALVKGFTEMHGGSVVARSEGEGHGSTFVVTLPVMAEPSDDVAPDSQTGVAPARTPRRILVADDNRDGAESLRMMLELLGHEVTVAHDGRAAVDAAETFRPEIILMDVGMPRMNGLDATRQIRHTPWGNTVTIVALTGWGQECDRVQSKAAGCDAHLIKPVKIDELHRILDHKPVSSSRHGKVRSAPASGSLEPLTP